jgi:hypothetical protein
VCRESGSEISNSESDLAVAACATTCRMKAKMHNRGRFTLLAQARRKILGSTTF